MDRRNRSKPGTIRDLLQILSEGPSQKTALLYAANLNSRSAKDLICYLLTNNYIEFIDTTEKFHITDQGTTLLAKINDLGDIL